MPPDGDDPGLGPEAVAGQPWAEPAEAATRLILVAPQTDADGLVPLVSAGLEASRPAALLVDPVTLATADRLPLLARLRDLAHEAGAALLLEGDAVLVVESGADGVQLARTELIAPARRLLGPERLIGAVAGLSRHEAMVAGEEGADYVLMAGGGAEERGELVAWWSELFVLPVAAEAGSAEDAASLAAAGADFLQLAASFWAGPKGPWESLSALPAGLRRSRAG